MSEDTTAAPAPLLRIVRGQPSAQEIAALVVVLSAAPPSPVAASGPQSWWADPARLARPPVTPSGWWACALPR